MPNKTTTMSRQSVLKSYLDHIEDEIIDKLINDKNGTSKLDDITRADLNARLELIKDIKNVCEQRGRY